MSTPASKSDLISALKESAVLTELTGANPFHCRAIENAARVLEGIDGQPAEWLATGALKGVKGVGKGIVERVEQWVENGKLDELEELRAKVPAGLPEMMTIPSLGPKKIKMLWQDRGIDSLAKLEEAARAGALNDLAGFGEKSVEKILAGIDQRRKYSARHHVDTAAAAAGRIFDRLRPIEGVQNIEVAGSLRRRRETVKDLDFIVTAPDTEKIMDAFIATPGVEKVVNHGPTKSSILLAGGIPVDLRVVEPPQFAAALNYFTGSKEHNTQLRGRAKKMGFKLNEYGLFPEDSDTPVKLADEAALYKKLGLPYIEPELREGRGEIEAAEAGDLPELIADADMRGVLHCHTTYSDGKNTVEEMARACQKLGYEYLALCDHSQTAAYAGGLKADDLKRQADEIDAVNEKLKGFTILKGVESDILAGGELDYPDDVLARLDLVVCSIHSRMTMPRDEMTARICRALEHPAATILAHPTGRLLLRREPFEVDLEKVLATAAAHGVAVEINANPWRLDLDWTWIKRAKEMGCRFAINPDAHNTENITHIHHGIGIARKGWLTTDDVINTLPLAAFKNHLASRAISPTS
jgi:DNA polymerase (family 10)